tara:strand:+ start:268 stop:723 length:456 start_codon:yes stop_codon:yes gene_type:complete
MVKSNSTVKWLIDHLRLAQNGGTIEGSDVERRLWNAMVIAEKETGCDPVRGAHLTKSDDGSDIFVVSFSYFSIAVLGLVEALHGHVRWVAILGQGEVPEAKKHMHSAAKILMGTLDDFLVQICEYSKEFDGAIRAEIDPENASDEDNDNGL